MSGIKHTILSIMQIVSDLKGEASVVTTAPRARAISRAEKDFALRDLWRIYYYKNQTKVGDATNDYTIDSVTYPMRPKGLAEVFVATTGSTNMTPEEGKYQIVDFNNFKYNYNADSTTRMVYEWYDVANDAWKMHINPAPAATDTITYSYFWEPPAKTSSSEYVYCPNPKILALLALADVYTGEEEYDVAQVAKSDAEQMIQELKGLEVMPAQNQIYTMGVGNTGGIGTY